MDKEKIKQFIISQREAGIPDTEIHSYLVEKGAIQIQNPTPEKASFNSIGQAQNQTAKDERQQTRDKIAGFVGGRELAKGLGQALAGNNKVLDKNLNDAIEQQTQLLKRRKEISDLGGDLTAINKALEFNANNLKEIGAGAEDLVNPENLTNKQVIGSALQLATTASAGKILGTANKIPMSGVGLVKGAVKGATTGAIGGVATGALTGASQGLIQDKSTDEILKDTGTGALIGGATGGILGTLVGGVTGRVKSSEMRRAILDNQYSTGEKIAPTSSSIKNKTIKIARQQGFNDVDIEFVNSMKPQDKLKAQKMIELAQKASVDKRAIERPIDVVGDSMTDRIKFIQSKNSVAGKAVDTTAKALKGQKVDATPVREKALSLLEDIGVTANKDGTPNWSKSIFKKTPELEKKIMKALSDLPAGEMDAYDLHNFKKSIDEVVNYGVGGEGLKGKSASILKAIRASADEVLDGNFADYNKANTDYRATREVLDIADDLFGKKVGIVKERGGQLLRSVFSNNTQRPRVMALIEQLDNTSKSYGGKFKDNLIDQALFTEILEDVYGTQATTSLQGQFGRALKGTQAVIAGIKNPVKGTGELLAAGAEKAIGISDENKKKILSALLREF